jgi:AcrR family transcriptional regulator
VTPTKAARQNDEPAAKRPRGRPRLTSPSPEYVARLEQIVDAAAEVFHQKGYDAGSLDDVAEALDLRKASLYHYVNSKAQLLYHIFDRSLNLGLARLEEMAASTEDPVERLAAFVSHQVSIVSEERSMFSVFFSARPRLEDEYEKRIRELERRYLHYYIDAVKAAMEAGAIPTGNPRYTAQAVLGMSSWVYKWFDPNEDDWTDVCRSFVRLILHGDVALSLPSSGELMHLKKPVARG